MVNSLISGFLLCVTLASLYVSSLYVCELFQPNIGRLGRDHPAVISRRTVSVVISTVVAWKACEWYTGEVWALPPASLLNLSLTVIQTLVLMIGPLQARRITLPPTHIALRNIVTAPISEELVFREFFIRILLHAGYSRGYAGFMAPIVFALAHVHHNYKQSTILMSLLAVAHTCVFGWIASMFLLKRSVWDAIASHVLCNAIGLPQVLPNRILLAGGACAFLCSVFIL